MPEVLRGSDRQKALFEKMDAVQLPQIVVTPADMEKEERECRSHLFAVHRLEAEKLRDAGEAEAVVKNLAFWQLTQRMVYKMLREAGIMSELNNLFGYEPSGTMHDDACSLFLKMQRRESPLKDEALRAQMQKIFAKARQTVVIR